MTTTSTVAPRATIPMFFERDIPFELRAADENGDGLTLEGVAIVFGQRATIESWEGTFEESIRKGSCTKTFRERTPVIQFDHGRHPVVGSIPIASFSSGFPRETDNGVEVRARIFDNWMMLPVREAIASGAIHGMSFRFEVVRDEWTDKKGAKLSRQEVSDLLWTPNASRCPLHRELIELKVPEMGPVVFPAYEGTSVSVRASDIAYLIRSNPDYILNLQHTLGSLARAAFAETEPVIEDTEIPSEASEVARALLFNLNPVKDSGSEDLPDDEVRVENDDATPRESAPGDNENVAPPVEAPNTPDARRKYARLNYVTLNRVGKVK